MPRPSISFWSGQLFRRQLNAVLDWLEINSGGGGGGPATWGFIGGTLSSQTDLQSALNGKASGSHAHVAADVTDFAAASDVRVSAGVAAHVALSDPHPQYLTGAEGDAAYAALGHSHSVAWGDLSGSLSAQADLQTALDGKVDLAGDTMTGPLVTAAPAVAAGFMLTPGASDPSGPTDGEMWRRTSDLRTRIGGTSYTFTMNNGSSTFTGKKTFTPSIAGSAYLNVAHGVAPSAPVDGDIWTETTGVYAQVNGVTKQLDAAGGGGASPVLSWVI